MKRRLDWRQKIILCARRFTKKKVEWNEIKKKKKRKSNNSRKESIERYIREQNSYEKKN